MLPPLSGVSDAPTLCHYVSELHALERRASVSEKVWQHLTTLLPDGSFLLGLSSILWREAWKYGERAFRYCQHDIGHALAGLRFSAVLCGWDLQLVQGWSTVDDRPRNMFLAQTISSTVPGRVAKLMPDSFRRRHENQFILRRKTWPNDAK